MDLQLQESQVGIAIERPVLALLGDIILEDGGGLGVISVQALEDGVDVGRPGLALVKSGNHCEIGNEERKEERRRGVEVEVGGEEDNGRWIFREAGRFDSGGE